LSLISPATPSQPAWRLSFTLEDDGNPENPSNFLKKVDYPFSDLGSQARTLTSAEIDLTGKGRLRESPAN
jgi:hypothetical protein